MPNIDEYSDLAYGARCNNVNISDLSEIVLELTGYNDGYPWHWICKRDDGGYAYITGGCDYTGWDCQSGMDRHDADTLDGALALSPQDERHVFEDMISKGDKARDSIGY